MIRINLLGKKKIAAMPFGIDEKLEKLGVSLTDFNELRPALVRLITLVVGLYIGNFVPTYLYEEKMKELDEKQTKLAMKSGELQKELNTKRDIRKQMEQLNKEEVELQRQLNAVNALQRDRASAFSTLNDVVQQLAKTQKVWVEDLKYENRKVTLNGRAWEYFPINDFVKAITESTRYTNVIFREISAEEAKKLIAGVPEALQKTKKFSLEFNVRELE